MGKIIPLISCTKIVLLGKEVRTMNTAQVETLKYDGEGFNILMSFGQWRIAALNSADRFKKENFCRMERHLETDEVFILFKGAASLVTGGSEEKPGEPEIIDMVPGVLYNVKKNVWHHVFLEAGTELILVENEDTGVKNTVYENVKK